MIGRRSVIGIAALIALALSAFGAANASAAQRAYTCEPAVSPTVQFSDAHCKVSSTASPGFKHSLITTAIIMGTNAKTASSTTAAEKAVLAGTLSGVETEVQCTTVNGEGSLTNAASSVTGTGTIVYSGCTVAKPSGQGCVVTGGTVTTEPLTATTVGQEGSNVKFSPTSGTKFATIPISGCTTEALNNKFPVTGTLVASTSGATLITTEPGVTTQNTLKFGGNKAGLGGALTISNAATTIAISITP